MRDDSRKTTWIILVLVLVIVVLLGVMAYSFWIQPSYQKFIYNKQVEAYNQGVMYSQTAFLNEIASQIQQTGYVQIPLNENQTLYLAPFNPQQNAGLPMA